MAKDTSKALINENRRARFDYDIQERFEGGLVLMGSEVKSLRAHNVNLNEAYASFVGNDLFLIGAHISPYENAGYSGHEPRRTRKILMHRKELDKLKMAIEAKGMTLVPTKLYWKNGRAKVEIGLAKGKKQVDKRETIKRREWDRSKHRILKGEKQE